MKRQLGAAAILALILLILGAITMLTSQADLMYNLRLSWTNQQRLDIQEAAIALQGWQRIHRGLPCPDLDQDGWSRDTCLSKNKMLGWLPWKKLNLIRLRKSHILYKIELRKNKQLVTLKSKNYPYNLILEFPHENN